MLPALLVPHGLALLCFAGSYIVVAVTGTNRSLLDLRLGEVGFILGVIALFASATAIAVVVLSARHRGGWPWLGAHMALSALIIVAGGGWIGAHLA